MLDKCKAKAALAAVESIELEDGMTVGIGSGSTVVHAVRQLEAKCAEAGKSDNRGRSPATTAPTIGTYASILT